uniref:Coronin n=1 Tax=Sphenodon punctatus TaxID=8508 RepID=A0A8D0GW63_SPHPU
MSWHPQYRSSKFRHVYGKAASKENCYDCVPITRSVHDNHFCAVNPHFIAVVTECAGGGAFLVIPVHQTGKLDPHYPRICGHKGNVLDIKWNPFNDFVIASCSEDRTVKIWDIPKHLLTKNITDARKELLGHARRVGLIEWHPTANNILFSTGYDYKIMVWNLDTKESVIQAPVKTIGFHTDVILSMSFNTDGSLLATACRDKRIRLLDPRAGTVLQVGRVSMIQPQGVPRGNGLYHVPQSSLPFPCTGKEKNFSFCLTLTLPWGVGKGSGRMREGTPRGDGNIRYYELSAVKPYLNYLMEYRSALPQKGIGIMPKRGLDVSTCEIFRFYKLIPAKNLIEPVSMIVPRRSESYQEDIYPMTAGAQPALTAQEWLSGVNKGPVFISLRPGSIILNSLPPFSERKPSLKATEPEQHQDRIERVATEDNQRRSRLQDKRSQRRLEENLQDDWQMGLSNGLDKFECPPPKTENELLQMFYRQQEEIRRLRDLVNQRDVQIKQLELAIKNIQADSGRY